MTGTSRPRKKTRPPVLCAISLGCNRNLADTESLLGAVSAQGWDLTADPELADVVVVNTCGFVEQAVSESIDTLLELAACKKSNPGAKLVALGCLVQRHGPELAEELPEVDAFYGPGAIETLAADLAARRPLTRLAIVAPEAAAGFIDRHPRLCTTLPVAYVKISEGCQSRCTFCAIPRLRGPLVSRPAEAILAETARLVNLGAREIVLTAQESTAWGTDLDGRPDLALLLSALARAHSDVWLRFLYGHPRWVTDALVETVARHPQICPYFDIPIQHASDRLLKRMGRNTTRRDLAELFARIRKRIPHATLRTTLLVGFPGETEKDVDELEAFIRDTAFDHLGVFVYSDADDLPSHRLGGHVPADLATERRDRLMEAQAAISLAKNQQRVGQQVDVLVDRAEPDGDSVGHTRFQAPEVDGVTHVAGPARAGDVKAVRITDADTYDLFGKVVGERADSA